MTVSSENKSEIRSIAFTRLDSKLEKKLTMKMTQVLSSNINNQNHPFSCYLVVI